MSLLTEDDLDMLPVTDDGDKLCEVRKPACSKQAAFLVFFIRLCSCSDLTQAMMCIGHKDETVMYGGVCLSCGAILPFKGARPVSG